MTDETKTENAGSPTTITVNVPVTRRSPDYRSIYVNNVKFGITAFEFSIIFAEIAETPEAQLYIDQKAKIIMSPVHAKLFADVLLANIKNFEAQFGEIKLPPGITMEKRLPTVESPDE
jgi:hypothetical protein